MAELTKRLHVSGLTPSIKPEDLCRRLSSFGKVTAMDGFGARDALGDPRKFGFVTMEIGAKELSRCLNVLSGSTWKGAKLRIGEAKPDFRERLARINAQPPKPDRPKRTRARNHGYPSATLPLIPLSASAAASTPGWIATPSGRVVRPMRMRPERPLDPVRTIAKDTLLSGKVKKRTKPPPVRARRRRIDPTQWDSVYLKGVFLDAVPVPLATSSAPVDRRYVGKHDSIDEEHDGDTSADGANEDVFSELPAPPRTQERTRTTPSIQQARDFVIPPSPRHTVAEPINVRDETNTALAMLGEMFGDKEDWDGRESVEEMDILEGSGHEMQVDDDIEIVPRDSGEGERKQTTKGKGKERTTAGVRFANNEHEAAEGLERDEDQSGSPVRVTVEPAAQTAAPAGSTPATNLKALFAPREDASFSLLGHFDVDLDLELDVDILGINAPSGIPQDHGHPSEPTSSISHSTKIPTTMPATKHRSHVTLDPALPLLFPPIDSLPYPSSGIATSRCDHGDAPSSLLYPSTTRVRGLCHLPPSTAFSRTAEDTTEAVRERWEKDKTSLTHEWKKAWRGARGSRRGRVGAEYEFGGGY